MSQTPNLLITEMAANQAQKETTFNTAVLELEGALTDKLDKAFPSDADLTLTSTEGGEALDHYAFNFTGSISTTRNVIVPTNKKVYAVQNSTTGGHAVTVKTASGTGVAVANGAGYAILYCDGTNVVQLGGTGGGATAFTGLSDVPASYSGQANKLVAVKSDETGLDFVAAGGGSLPAGTPAFSLPPMSLSSSTNLPPGDSMWSLIPANALRAIASSVKVEIGVCTGIGNDLVVNNAIIAWCPRFASSGSWTGTAQLKWGGVSNPTLAKNAFHLSDAVSVTLDSAYDYYVILYADPGMSGAAYPSMNVYGSLTTSGFSAAHTMSGDATAVSGPASLTGGSSDLLIGVSRVLTA